ncbi:TPA: hypothetical protein ACNV5P_004745 [Enterobacter asburiae]
MSTITKKFTKEQLIAKAEEQIKLTRGLNLTLSAKEHVDMCSVLFEIALASLEAEAVAMRWRYLPDGIHGMGEWNYRDQGYIDTLNAYHLSRQKELLYTAPPAPVVDCVPLGDSPYDVPYSMPSNLRELIAEEIGILFSDDDAQSVWNVCRSAAMLQGAEPVTTANKLPFDQWLSQQAGTIDVECGCVMTEVFFHWLRVAYEAGNSPVIPDGWVMVPVEPTAEMISSGIAAHYERSQIQIHDRPAPGPMECAYVAMLAAAPHFREIVNSSTNNCREKAETSTKCWCHTCRPVKISDMRFVVCPDCGNKRCPHANDHRNACTGSNETGQEGSAYPAAPQQEVK